MIKKISRSATCISLLFLLTNCAPMLSGAMNAGVTEKEIVTKTANYFGATKQEIEVSNIVKDTLWTTYTTRYAKQNYSCSIYYGTVECKKP